MTALIPTRADVEGAAIRLQSLVRRTPVLLIHGSEIGVPGEVALKLELLQHTGSFKARGALNSVLSLDPGVTGVAAASGGNHGAAVAWAAAQVGISADIFVPDHAPQAKLERIRGHSATVHLVPGFVHDALEQATAFAARSGVALVHPYDQFSTVCGAGTVGLEVAEQVPDAAHVLVACGGGGLYAGVAAALDGIVAVTPVEPVACPSLSRAVEQGGSVAVGVGGVAVDSLGAGTAGRMAFARAHTDGVRVPLVSEEAIIEARGWLWDRCRILAEAGAAVPVAALMSGVVEVHPGSTVVALVSGGNSPAIP